MAAQASLLQQKHYKSALEILSGTAFMWGTLSLSLLYSSNIPIKIFLNFVLFGTYRVAQNKQNGEFSLFASSDK